MTADAGDRARLERIRRQLADEDPLLVAVFESWRPPVGCRSLPPGWSTAPTWLLMVLVAGVSCLLTPALGGVVVVACAVRWATKRAEERAGPTAGPRSRR